MKHHEALRIANAVVQQLAPHCYRIEIAGSVRRGKPEVKDIEIVAIPRPYDDGLFAYGLAPIVNQWEKVKGDLIYGVTRYTQRILPEGIKLDLFFANEQNWGLIYAMRTGSAEYSHKVLAANWVRSGYKSNDGFLTRGGRRIAVKEETDLFRMIGVKYIPPERREYL